MSKIPIPTKKKVLFLLTAVELIIAILAGRVFYIQSVNGDYLQELAYEQQTRDRLITPDRGSIYDRNMNGLAVTQTVASISVIRAQIEDAELVAQVLSAELDIEYDTVLAKAQKRVALERVKTKVDVATAERIREYGLAGVIIDEDVQRVYPYSTLASQVIGFVGKDNQGIIGLEAKYDEYLSGESGKILTETDARGVELEDGVNVREAPSTGDSLVTSIDLVIQQYAEQCIKKIVEAKDAKRGAIIVMNPQTGEILAMANEPNFDLNEPFTINDEELAAQWSGFSSEEQTNYLNQMWRNFTINDTYEPGSTFKVVTSAMGLEEGVVTPQTTFVCRGSVAVGGFNIRCWRSPRSHGVQTFVEGVQNSCNPVFMQIAADLGAETFYSYMLKFGFAEKTGVDLPGEAVGIMHAEENIGSVELATMSFGQSFQITPLQLLRAASAVINGGYLITPHIGTTIVDGDGNVVEELQYEQGEQIISKETSETMKWILESVVEEGTGNKTYIAGYSIGGKTATSEKLPRKQGKYISSFLAFAPADDAQVIALVMIDEPTGTYYGGQVAGPVMKELMENILPYLGIEPDYSEEELKMDGVAQVSVPDLVGQKLSTSKNTLNTLKLTVITRGEGDIVTGQFPNAGELINQGEEVILYLGEEEPEVQGEGELQEGEQEIELQENE